MGGEVLHQTVQILMTIYVGIEVFDIAEQHRSSLEHIGVRGEQDDR
jgi:hypothetical protein